MDVLKQDQAHFWWHQQGPWVEPPNQRRHGISGVQLVTLDNGHRYYLKRQTGHLFRSLRFPRGRPTAMREWLAFKACRRLGIPVPQVVFFDVRRKEGQWQAVLVTAELTHYCSLQQGLAEGRWSEAQLNAILDELSRLLIRMHRRWRQHGHPYPKEIFVDDRNKQPHLVLLDMELSRYKLSRHSAAENDLRRLFHQFKALDVPLSARERILTHYRRAGIRLRKRKLDHPF